jgi:hypothetical protein
MTQDAAGPKGRRHPSALNTEHGVTHRVDPAIKAMKPPSRKPALDRVLAETELDELPACDDAVLPSRDRGDPLVRVD